MDATSERLRVADEEGCYTVAPVLWCTVSLMLGLNGAEEMGQERW